MIKMKDSEKGHGKIQRQGRVPMGHSVHSSLSLDTDEALC